jgi:hypothetical protein
MAKTASQAVATARQVAGWLKEDIRTYRETRAAASA